MALIAVLSSSTIGAICGLFGWLFFGLSLASAFWLYLACGFCLPAAMIAVAALRGGPQTHSDAGYAEEAEAMVA